MASGVWIIVVIPAIIAFLFGAWVMSNVLEDVANRNGEVFDPLQGVFRGEAPPGEVPQGAK